MIKYLIVDDEKPARDELKFLLGDFNDFELIGEADNGIECLNIAKEKNIDVVFLDIDMPRISGIVVASKLSSFDNPPLIIFVTAYNEYAINAFEVNALDYLLKPISALRLENTIEKIKHNRINLVDPLINNKILFNDLNTSSRICLEQNGVYMPLDIDSIIYAKVEGKNTIIFTRNKEYNYSGTLSQLESKLTNTDFFRTHRSYILNIDYIETIEPWFNNTYMVKVKYLDEKVPVSRSQIKKFKEFVGI
ncbi:LytR/AlgR family response regulator transcription factor [Helicovermis profundi]|uniref:Stage 0 sporulation protein A homolog n=1 Tax=Helicovermis profundi TaxID=3065157 RepID=A0AAU9EDR4_9FIRM|nr:LytTR family DNA-binding domain-containing protein [Clostridia bacterium S502]